MLQGVGHGGGGGGQADAGRYVQDKLLSEVCVPVSCRESDTAAEVAAKLTLIAIYNERLTERRRRREFIQHHGLLDVKPQQVP